MHMEIRRIEPDEEERGAPYLAGIFRTNRAGPNLEDVDDGDFVDPPVTLRKSLKIDPLRACNESKNAVHSTFKLKEIMSDIRLRQDQIISQQIDLKYEIRAIQRFVDDKIGGFLGELRAKLDGQSSAEKRGQIVLYNSLNTGIGSGLRDEQNISDLLDDKFYTDDVMEEV
ncbi:Uncharacterized protein Adt_23653 [Abeliophyllum distichum]|uniref:Uncharacterized protein n=1 Tax=Abeliophyllum distichum TaxID=126358 RepID=A0ABD1SCJ7_9LAMI